MAKKVKKIVSKKMGKNPDWKFLITLAVLVVIGLGVFSIYRGLAAAYPEVYVWGFPNGHHINTAQKAWDDEHRKTAGGVSMTTAEQNKANKAWEEHLKSLNASY